MSVSEAQVAFQNEFDHLGVIQNSIGLVTKGISRYTVFPTDMNNLYWNGAMYLGSAPDFGLTEMTGVVESAGSWGSIVQSTISSAVWQPVLLPYTAATIVLNPLNWLRAAGMGLGLMWYAPAVANQLIGVVSTTVTKEVEKSIPVAKAILAAGQIVTP